jgi:hypothetical protein
VWRVLVHDGDDYLVWIDDYPTRPRCFKQAAHLNEIYAGVVFSCAQVFGVAAGHAR